MHQEIRTARANSGEDLAAKEGRKKIDSQIEALMQQGSPFSILLVVVTNLEGM